MMATVDSNDSTVAAFTSVLIVQVGWLGLKVGTRRSVCIHKMNLFCHNDSTINTIVVLLLLLLLLGRIVVLRT